MIRRFDFLIVGSGIAGLSYALKIADKGSVAIVTKSTLKETNTWYAQGGIAAVTEEPDNNEKHVRDTILCGDGICDEEVVRMVVTEAPGQINELTDMGARFDKKADGKFELLKEGGHSEYRILHHKDITGSEIERVLIEKIRLNKNIHVLENFFAIDLITQHHLGQLVRRSLGGIECYGIYALNIRTNTIDTVLSKTTLLATGGIGNIYQTTTNPSIATGDGIAMVSRAKGIIENMEFIQFHPTTLFNPGERPSFLITEALRGFGAILRTRDNREFMYKYDKRECLASRDIVARAIDHELKMQGDDFVYLDASHLDKDQLIAHFPNIYEKCLKIGIDITKDYLPVVPGAHYVCGGIKIDMNGRSSISNLYAAGECASSGMHGANRLASNSLLEALVFADRASKDALQAVKNIQFKENIPPWNDEGTSHPEEMILITQEMKELQQIMSNYVGIVRSNLRLKRAYERLELLYKETEELYRKSTVSMKLCELRNAINVAYLIIKMAKNRKESRGLHYTIDYRNKNIVV
jgi:L-aspartate oxidase